MIKVLKTYSDALTKIIGVDIRSNLSWALAKRISHEFSSLVAKDRSNKEKIKPSDGRSKEERQRIDNMGLRH